MENEKCTLYDLEYGEKTKERGKGDMHTIRPGKWQETLKNVEKKKCSLWDLKYCEKTENLGK